MYRRVLASVILGGACITAARFWDTQPKPYAINITPSMPLGIYRVHPQQRRLHRGEVVIVCLSGRYAALALQRGYADEGRCGGGRAALIKEVAAVSGDAVTETPAGVVVDGKLLPMSRAMRADAHSRPLQAYRCMMKRLASGTVWLASPCSTGFDSRYFGPLPEQEVVGTATAVLSDVPRMCSLSHAIYT